MQIPTRSARELFFHDLTSLLGHPGALSQMNDIKLN